VIKTGRQAGRVNGWIDGWMDGWMDGWLDGWIEQVLKKRPSELALFASCANVGRLQEGTSFASSQPDFKPFPIANECESPSSRGGLITVGL